MVVTLDSVSKGYGARVLFENVSLRVGARDRIALIGPNGSGKTTLLEIVAGIVAPDSGRVARAKGLAVGYLTQEAIEIAGRTVLEEALTSAHAVTSLEHHIALLESKIAETPPGALQKRLLAEYGALRERFEHAGGYSIESNARYVLAGMGFRESDMDRPAEELSGGWLMRLAMSKLLLSAPDLLLLDEPTNHLDLETVAWLEEYLRSYEGAIVLVSHDRDFMSALVDTVVAIDRRLVKVYAGTYEHYLAAQELEHEQQVAAYRSQQREIASMERFVERFRAKNTKAKQAQDRVKKLERIERISLPDAQETLRFSFPQPRRTGEEVVRLRGVRKAFGERVVYDALDLTLYRQDKVALVGPNGAGKTTLLKILAGVVEPDEGTRELGVHVDVAYFAQHQLEALDPEKTVYGELEAVTAGWTQSEIRGLLGAFLFTGDDVKKKVSVLSGGERCRLALAKMLVRPSPLLCLDEPTNHLDMSSVNVLETALQRFAATLVLITHDRHLIRSVATKIIDVRDGGVMVYEGGWDHYLERRSRLDSAKAIPDAARLPTKGQKSREARRSAAEERNRAYRDASAARAVLREAEQELAAVQDRHDELVSLMADPGFYRDAEAFEGAMREYAELKKRLPTLEESWIEAAEAFERAGGNGSA